MSFHTSTENRIRLGKNPGKVNPRDARVTFTVISVELVLVIINNTRLDQVSPRCEQAATAMITVVLDIPMSRFAIMP